MSIQSATPQDTFDHMLGSGATSYSWWLVVKPLSGILNGESGQVEDDWAVELVCEDGNDATTTVTITHDSVMKAARTFLHTYLSEEPQEGMPQVPDTVIRECAHLVFEPDATDFDASSADCLLQLMVLGEIVFG